jgi:alpha-glucosidase
LFGDNLMVCPVTTKGAQTRTIYLPEGEWYDWWTGKKYSGKQYVHVVTPLDTLPVFAKAGAIIPMQPAMKYVGEKPVDVITLDVFPSANSSFKLYEDDGQSLKYEQGDYSISKINCTSSTNKIQIRISKPNGKFIPPPHSYVIKLHTVYTPKQVLENGKLNQQWKINNGLVYLSTSGNNTKDLELTINY